MPYMLRGEHLTKRFVRSAKGDPIILGTKNEAKYVERYLNKKFAGKKIRGRNRIYDKVLAKLTRM
jgi:hypothetical protein